MSDLPFNDKNDFRQDIVKKFLPLASVILLIYSSIEIFIMKDFAVGTLHAVNLVIILIATPGALRAKKITLGSNLLCSIGMITIMPWLVTGGPANSGFWLSITYVVGAFLVAEKRWAIFWLSLYALTAVAIVGLSLNGTIKVAYSLPQLLNLAFIYLITFAFVYLFNHAREYYLDLVLKREEEMIKANNVLDATNRELKQFAYVVSHDLQEPLRNITTYIGLLEARGIEKTDAESGRHMKVVLTSADRMKTLIRELLNLMLIGHSESKMEKVNCGEVLKEIIVDLEPDILKSGASIKSAGLPSIVGNKTEVKQLLQNLIGNAVKFKRENTPAEVHIKSMDLPGEWEFSVSDNGIGIEEKYWGKIFLAFQRLHTQREYEGTGIGLALCKKIIDTYGGKIWINSTINVGTTVYFTIPKRKLVTKPGE